MAALTQEDVTLLLHQWQRGNRSALDELMPLVYNELRRLAGGYLRNERPDHTLQATALVNEAYLRLAGHQAGWENRAHFFGAAAEAMRRILVDYARKRKSDKRGGADACRVSLGDLRAVAAPEPVDVIALDEALQELARLDPQQSRLVELRYFGGLSIEETAAVLNISPATVKRHWLTAKAWLFVRMKDEG